MAPSAIYDQLNLRSVHDERCWIDQSDITGLTWRSGVNLIYCLCFFQVRNDDFPMTRPISPILHPLSLISFSLHIPIR